MTGRPSTSRAPLLVPGAVAATVAVLAVLSVLAARTAAGPAEAILASAGPLARDGAPVAAFVADLAGALVLGGAAVAGWVVRRGEDRAVALRAVAVASVVWTLAQLALLLTSYAVATGQPIGSGSFGSDLPVYLGTELGLWMLASLVLAAAATVVAVGATGPWGARALALCAGCSILAKAMTGHASGNADHETATTTMLVHLLAVGVWIGGLAVLQLLPGGDRDAAGVVRRYSRLALVCWVAILASGVWALSARMNGPGDLLTSAYVQIAALKTVLLVLLGAAGVLQRRLLADAAAPGGGFDGAVHRRLAILELALMGLAVALAAAMSSSPPPADSAPQSTEPAFLLTGYPLPPAPTLGGIAAAWRPDAFALAAAAVLVLAWWWPTAPRRDARATRFLLAAVIALLAVQCGPLAVYGKVLVSAHVLQHALLLLVVGPLLAAAFDVRLPARAPRWVAPVLGFAAPGMIVLAYAWPTVLRLALEAHVPHLVLIVGSVGLGVALGAAVRASRAAAPATGVVLVVAALQLALGSRLLVPSWFGATGRTWFVDALADQRRGGWALLAIAVGWTVAAAALSARQSRGVGSASNSERTVRSRAMRSSRSAKGS